MNFTKLIKTLFVAFRVQYFYDWIKILEKYSLKEPKMIHFRSTCMHSFAIWPFQPT